MFDKDRFIQSELMYTYLATFSRLYSECFFRNRMARDGTNSFPKTLSKESLRKLSTTVISSRWLSTKSIQK